MIVGTGKNFMTLTFLIFGIWILCLGLIALDLFGKDDGMVRRCILPLFALMTPLTLAAAPKGKGDGLTQKEIVDVIQSYSDDQRACFQASYDKTKEAEGKVKIRFLIGLKGQVDASQVEQNTFKDKSLGVCLQNKMKAWKFPKPRGGQQISIAYPFEFKAAPPPPEALVAPDAPLDPAPRGTPPIPADAPIPAPTDDQQSK